MALYFPSSSFFSGFDDFFSSPLGGDLVPTLSTHRDNDTSVLRRSSPFYEITEDDKQYQLAVDVPGVKAGDINVELEGGGRILHVSGGRKFKCGNESTETKFERRFTVGTMMDPSKITANLANGVLVVSIPKETPKQIITKIAVTENLKTS